MAAVDLARCFGDNVCLARRTADLTQEELGFLAALHRTEISQLERGIRLARIDTLIKLAGALQVPPGDLLKGMAWTPRRVPPSGRFIVRVEAG
ncbi:MAG TPA: helix-turn-helix transcriptional regulator [Solirubrobacterales bacterium]|nr:helix-turn-helix transcriptional regulator [Solirubrobacterales bacterium]